MSPGLATAGYSEQGLGPQWWRSGTRTRRWWTAAVLMFALVGLDLVFEARAGVRPPQVAMTAVGEVAELTVALLFWMWRCNRIGPLMIAYVLLQMSGDLVTFFPASPAAWTSFYPLLWAWQVVWVWFMLAFPSGRLWNRASAYLLVYIAVFLCGVPLVQELFRGEPRTYLYLGHGWSGLDLYTRFYGVDTLLIWLPVAAFLVARLLSTAPGARRRFLPLYISAGYLVLFVVPTFAYFYLTTSTFVGPAFPSDMPGWYQNYALQSGLFLFLSAVGAAFGLARVRQRRSAVADLVVELGEVAPGHVRKTLARTLGDPSLVLGLWVSDRDGWVDEEGREIELPMSNDRGVTSVGDQLAVLVHHPDLLDQPRLLEAVGSAARLALENERLHAELRAQLAELRESRARLVRTADEERRRLERDLHDGAQQRLLAVGIALQMLRSRVGDDGKPLLAEADAELRAALTELRELARGIHPAVLTDQGLDAAVRTLAARCNLPVEVASEGGRLPPEVETVAYFVVAEGLANVVKYAHARHAWVKIGRDCHELVVEVRDDGIGGAAPEHGTGLVGLDDRVGALGGSITLESPVGGGTRLHAVVPCTARDEARGVEAVGP